MRGTTDQILEARSTDDFREALKTVRQDPEGSHTFMHEDWLHVILGPASGSLDRVLVRSVDSFHTREYVHAVLAQGATLDFEQD